MSSPASDSAFSTEAPPMILVGLDGSRTSLRAAAYAVGLARRQRSHLLAVYVSRVPASVSSAPAAAAAMTSTLDQIAAQLEEQLLSRAAEMGISVTFRSVRGDPLAELARIASQTHADTIVVGASEHLGHRIVGSLGTRLIRSGKWPVIVVP